MSHKTYIAPVAKVKNTAQRLKAIEATPVSVNERLATSGRPKPPALPIDSSLLPWDEIFALRGCPLADGISLPNT